MKNYSYYFAIVAIVALGCQKVENHELETIESHTVSFVLGDPATKTEINGAGTSAQWTAGDAANFVVKENSTSGTSIALNTSTGVLSATFTGTPVAAEYKYNANMAGDRTGSGQPRVPVAQTASATSYDPNADILIAEEQSFNAVQGSLTMKFARPVVINKMTLKGLEEGETISTVLISSDVKITGYFDVDNKEWNAQYNEITVTVNQVVPVSGQIDVYFVTKPVEGAILTITANSATNTYTKTFASTIDFPENKFTTFGVSGLTKTPKVDYSGYYVLTNSAGSKMAKEWVSDANSITSVSVTLDAGNIYYDPDAVDISKAKVYFNKVTDTESTYFGMYSMLQNALYLYPAGDASNSKLKGKDALDKTTYWDVVESDGSWSIKATKSDVSRNVLQFNGSSSTFNCYASASQTAIKLYGIANAKPTPVITANNLSIGSAAVSTPTTTGATFNSNTNTVAAAAYDNAGLTEASTWLSTTVDSKVVKYTASKNDTGSERVGYIKITATNDESRSVVKTITVTQAPEGGVTLQYTLDGTITGGTSGYATFSSITQSTISWQVEANTNQNPWRIGGAAGDTYSRAIYSTTAIAANISQIDVTTGTGNGITVNSVKISVHGSAQDAASGDDEMASKTVTGNSNLYDKKITFSKSDATSWAGKYYRIVYNVTTSGTSGNKYVNFTKAEFYGAVAE